MWHSGFRDFPHTCDITLIVIKRDDKLLFFSPIFLDVQQIVLWVLKMDFSDERPFLFVFPYQKLFRPNFSAKASDKNILPS